MDRKVLSNLCFACLFTNFLKFGSLMEITTTLTLTDTNDTFYAPNPINGLIQDQHSNVYIGGRTFIYKLTENLQVLTNATTDQDPCSDKNNTECTSKNSILLVDNDKDLITACSDPHHGLCERRSLQGIGDVHSTATITPTLLNSACPVVAFSAPAHTGNNEIHVVVKINVSNIQNPTSSKCFVTPEIVEFNGDVDRDTKNTVHACQEDVDIKYGYGYEYKGYHTIVFAVVQSSSAKINRKYETHATIYHEPYPGKIFYKELELECKHNSISYDYLVEGKVAKPGADIIHKLNIDSHNTLVFFGIFAKSKEQTGSSDNSVLCMFPLEVLNGRPVENTAQYTNLHDSQNSYIINFLEPSQANAVLQFSHSVTALSITTVENNTIAFIGTDTGHVVKVLFVSDLEATQYEDVTVKDSASPVNRDMILGGDGKSLYVPIGSSVKRIQVEKCASFDTYYSCMNSNDPYCGWCYDEMKCCRQFDCKERNSGWGWAREEAIEFTSAYPTHIQNEKDLTLNIKNLPKYLSDSFECGFQYKNIIAKSRATVVQGPDRDNVFTLKCRTEAANSSDVVHQEHLYFYIGQTGISLHKTLFVGNCSKYSSCTNCTNNSKGCKWCSHDQKCVLDDALYCQHHADVINSHDCSAQISESSMPTVKNSRPISEPSVRGKGIANLPTKTIIVIIIIIATAILMIIVVAVGVVAYRAKKRRERKRFKVPPIPEDPPMLIPRSLWERLDQSLQESLDPHLIDSSRLVLDKKIGSGHFGQVFVGRLNKGEKPITIAIKTININTEDIREINEFMKESTIMVDFNHPNVMHLLGVVIKEDKPYIILPYMDKGDLNQHISDDNIAFTVMDLLLFIQQIAKGMHYLSKLKFVHRDLAARNCMVNSAKQVKIADFGLSRDIYEKDYYRVEDLRPVPIRWMSIESLEQSLYTTKSDVWSFGILMWEVMTRGIKPYPHLGHADMLGYLQIGKRLEKPPHAPQAVYNKMTRCWLENPEDRPSFEHLEQEFDTLLSNIVDDKRETVRVGESEEYLLPVLNPIMNDEYASVVRRNTRREVR